MDAIIWERLPGEPARWYRRFVLYRDLGPQRTLVEAHAAAARAECLAQPRLPARWVQIAATWRWEERAQAWDLWMSAQRDLDAPLPSDPDAYRVAIIERLMGTVYGVIVAAGLPSMSAEQARRVLPTLRGLLRDLILAHQTERLRRKQAAPTAVPPFSADELRQAERELADYHSARDYTEQDHSLHDTVRHEPAWIALRDVLATLYPEENSARRVADQANLEVGRIAFSRRALECWHAILREAERSGQLPQVIGVALTEYMGHVALHKALLRYVETTKGRRSGEEPRDAGTPVHPASGM